MEKSIEERTLSYWKASRAYYRHAHMTCSDAIHHLGDAFEGLDQARPLFVQASELQWDIINGKRISRHERKNCGVTRL